MDWLTTGGGGGVLTTGTVGSGMINSGFVFVFG